MDAKKGILDAELDYSMDIPFNLLGFPSIRFSSRLRCHTWIGNTSGDKDQSNDVVYVTANGEVYHLYSDCSYLVSSIKIAKVQKLRIKETAAVKNTGHANYVVKTMKNRLLHSIQIMETDITVRVYAVTFTAMYFLWIRIKHKKITDCAVNVKRGNDMVNGIIMTVLTIESIWILKQKYVMCKTYNIFLMALLGNLIFGYQSVISMAGGIAIGIIVLIYGLITKEGIGYGDGIMFMCLGTVLGLHKISGYYFYP